MRRIFFFNNEEPAVCSWIIFSSQLLTNERLKVGEKWMQTPRLRNILDISDTVQFPFHFPKALQQSLTSCCVQVWLWLILSTFCLFMWDYQRTALAEASAWASHYCFNNCLSWSLFSPRYENWLQLWRVQQGGIVAKKKCIKKKKKCWRNVRS